MTIANIDLSTILASLLRPTVRPARADGPDATDAGPEDRPSRQGPLLAISADDPGTVRLIELDVARSIEPGRALEMLSLRALVFDASMLDLMRGGEEQKPARSWDAATYQVPERERPTARARAEARAAYDQARAAQAGVLLSRLF